MTNIVCADVESKDVKMRYLMNELNEYFHKIVYITDEYMNEDNDC